MKWKDASETDSARRIQDATRKLAESGDLDQRVELLASILEGWTELVLTTPVGGQRFEPEPDTFNLLYKLCADTCPNIRCLALSCLSRSREHWGAIAPLFSQALQDKDDRIVATALNAIPSGVPDTAPLYPQYLTLLNHPHAAIRQKAARLAIAQKPAPEAVEVLAAHIRKAVESIGRQADFRLHIHYELGDTLRSLRQAGTLARSAANDLLALARSGSEFHGYALIILAEVSPESISDSLVRELALRLDVDTDENSIQYVLSVMGERAIPVLVESMPQMRNPKGRRCLFRLISDAPKPSREWTATLWPLLEEKVVYTCARVAAYLIEHELASAAAMQEWMASQSPAALAALAQELHADNAHAQPVLARLEKHPEKEVNASARAALANPRPQQLAFHVEWKRRSQGNRWPLLMQNQVDELFEFKS